MYANGPAYALVITVTLVTVAAAVWVHYEGLVRVAERLGRGRGAHRNRVLYGIFAVIGLHLIEIWLIEIWLFGVAYRVLAAVPGTGTLVGADSLGLLDAVYLSAAPFTTLGYGDVVPVGPIRLLTGVEALVGFVLLTWSASFTYLEMERNWRPK